MTEDNNKLTIVPKSEPTMMSRVGQAANQAASNYVFQDYQQRRAKKTLKTQTAALILWTQFLDEASAASALLKEASLWVDSVLSIDKVDELEDYALVQGVNIAHVYGGHYCQNAPAAWHGVTWGLVEGFVKWLLNKGYSLASVNNRLSAIKVYTRLASKAGTLPMEELALIREVRGYGQTEGKRVDMARPKTRVGYKKEDSIVLTAVQARTLKHQHPPTPQGIRDKLLLTLLLDLGLRASEVSALKLDDISENQQITVYRQKTDTTDRLRLSVDIQQSLAEYTPYMRQNGLLLRGSRKGGKLTEDGMSVRAIGARIKKLGRDILGVWELSPHDLRHTWATQAAKESSPFALRDAGGWTNMQTPSRYVERSNVANEGIKIDY